MSKKSAGGKNGPGIIGETGQLQENTVILKITKYIKENSDRQITNEELARVACMQGNYFYTFFPKANGYHAAQIHHKNQNRHRHGAVGKHGYHDKPRDGKGRLLRHEPLFPALSSSFITSRPPNTSKNFAIQIINRTESRKN